MRWFYAQKTFRWPSCCSHLSVFMVISYGFGSKIRGTRKGPPGICFFKMYIQESILTVPHHHFCEPARLIQQYFSMGKKQTKKRVAFAGLFLLTKWEQGGNRAALLRDCWIRQLVSRGMALVSRLFPHTKVGPEPIVINGGEWVTRGPYKFTRKWLGLPGVL